MQNKSVEEILISIQQILHKYHLSNKNILTFDDALIYLDVSDSYLYKKTSINAIEHYKPNGGKIYFLRKSLDEYILQNKIKSKNEIESKANSFVNGNKNWQ